MRKLFGRRPSRKVPDWYPDWRHKAFHELMQKTQRLSEDFCISKWPRYDYDLRLGKLFFLEDGVVRVFADVQVAGSTSAKAGNWCWSWANAHWPENMTVDAQQARDFGEEHRIAELAQDYVKAKGGDFNSLGWELTSVLVRIVEAEGAYRPQPGDDDTGLFLILKNVGWADAGCQEAGAEFQGRTLTHSGVAVRH